MAYLYGPSGKIMAHMRMHLLHRWWYESGENVVLKNSLIIVIWTSFIYYLFLVRHFTSQTHKHNSAKSQ